MGAWASDLGESPHPAEDPGRAPQAGPAGNDPRRPPDSRAVRPAGRRKILHDRGGPAAGVAPSEPVQTASDEARLATHRRHLGRLYPVLAHDLHSFLNAMVLNLELLQRAAAKEAIDAETAERIRSYAARVADEIPPLDRMLKAVVGQMQLSDPPTTRFDLRTVCEDLGIVFASYARYRKLRLRSSLAEVPVPVVGDRDAVEQALTVLLLETVEALPAGSELAMDLQVDRRHATLALAAETLAPVAGETSETDPSTAAREILVQNGAGIRELSGPDGAASLEISFRLVPEST